MSETISPQDPLAIIAGIRQFGLAPDGSDLRDLEVALVRAARPVEVTDAQVEDVTIPRDVAQALFSYGCVHPVTGVHYAMTHKAALERLSEAMRPRAALEAARLPDLSAVRREALEEAARDLLRFGERDKLYAHQAAARVRALIDTPAPQTDGMVLTNALINRLDSDSLDVIMEVVGEGPEFAQYNKGKSVMRAWFLATLRTLAASGASQ